MKMDLVKIFEKRESVELFDQLLQLVAKFVSLELMCEVTWICLNLADLSQEGTWVEDTLCGDQLHLHRRLTSLYFSVANHEENSAQN